MVLQQEHVEAPLRDNELCDQHREEIKTVSKRNNDGNMKYFHERILSGVKGAQK